MFSPSFYITVYIDQYTMKYNIPNKGGSYATEIYRY